MSSVLTAFEHGAVEYLSCDVDSSDSQISSFEARESHKSKYKVLGNIKKDF